MARLIGRIFLLVALPLCVLEQVRAAPGEFLFATNFEAAPDCSSIGLPGCPGFAIETPAAQIAGNTSVGYCYSFRAPSQVSAIARFSSIMSPRVAQVVVWQTTDDIGAPADGFAPGTFTANCGVATGSNARTFTWVYAAHASGDPLRMPDDDGNAVPVAFELPANAAGFLEILYDNPGVDTVSVPPVRLVANERPAAPYTSTATFLTIKAAISVPSDSGPHNVTGGCIVPSAAAHYWWFSSQTHRFATATEVDRYTGTTTPIVTSSGWTHPSIAKFPTSPFYSFSSGDQLLVTCTYLNNSGSTIAFGESYQTAEMCMAMTYLFPATQSQTCLKF